jgi:hypothetical protein
MSALPIIGKDIPLGNAQWLVFEDATRSGAARSAPGMLLLRPCYTKARLQKDDSQGMDKVMQQDKAVFCEVRYHLDPDRLEEFKHYARAWVRLIERHGGVHHGFFMRRPAIRRSAFPASVEQEPGMWRSRCTGFPTRMPTTAIARRLRSIPKPPP